jgi:hypothetical protein
MTLNLLKRKKNSTFVMEYSKDKMFKPIINQNINT